jgi:adenine/guanine phosphoribosyltransferase-like PRPP-binding protein
LIGAEVTGFVFLIELRGLRGREDLEDYAVKSFVTYD